MDWTNEATPATVVDPFTDLPASIGKAGATESVAFVAIIWGVIIATN